MCQTPLIITSDGTAKALEKALSMMGITPLSSYTHGQVSLVFLSYYVCAHNLAPFTYSGDVDPSLGRSVKGLELRGPANETAPPMGSTR
jgi:hypothetical protein